MVRLVLNTYLGISIAGRGPGGFVRPPCGPLLSRLPLTARAHGVRSL
jgi:hypothetical protein